MEDNKFVAPGISIYGEPGYYCGGCCFEDPNYTKRTDKTEMDKLNEFLINLGRAKGVGFRRKIVMLNKYINAIGQQKK